MFTVKQFERAYEEALEYLEPYVNDRDLQLQVSSLDLSMHPSTYDMTVYLKRSAIRYREVVRGIEGQRMNEPGKVRWLEVGCLYPAFPIALAKLGIRVSVMENYRFYPKRFVAMYREVEKRFGIRFIDIDASSPRTRISAKLNSTFDYASCLAVLEHIPHTPRFILQNIAQCLTSSGVMFCEVPNFFYWNNILKLVRGEHMQQPIEIVYDSGVPFVGHHREYALKDLLYVLEKSGFADFSVKRFNYSIGAPLDIKVALLHWPALVFKGFKEIILVRSRKRS